MPFPRFLFRQATPERKGRGKGWKKLYLSESRDSFLFPRNDRIRCRKILRDDRKFLGKRETRLFANYVIRFWGEVLRVVRASTNIPVAISAYSLLSLSLSLALLFALILLELVNSCMPGSQRIHRRNYERDENVPQALECERVCLLHCFSFDSSEFLALIFSLFVNNFYVFLCRRFSDLIRFRQLSYLKMLVDIMDTANYGIYFERKYEQNRWEMR